MKIFKAENADDTSALSIILLSVSMLSFVITIVGIKFRWFRHRLSFEQPEAQIESPVLLRTSSITEIRENCARGVYRKSSGDDSFMLSAEKTSVSTANGKTKAKGSKCFKCFDAISNYMLITFIENTIGTHYSGCLCLSY